MSKTFFYNHTIEEKDGIILVDSIEAPFATIKETKEWLKNQYVMEELTHEIKEEENKTLGDKVVQILQEHGKTNITNKLVEDYIRAITKNEFVLDKVVLSYKESISENRMEFVLEDNSKVLISKETLDLLKGVLSEEKEILDYMKKNTDNFLFVVENL